MQNGMLCSAYIKIDRHPGVLDLCIDKPIVVLVVEIAEVVPARARPLRHGVGLALVAAAVELDVEPLGWGFFERGLRAAMWLEVAELGQINGQLLRWNRASAPVG